VRAKQGYKFIQKQTQKRITVCVNNVKRKKGDISAAAPLAALAFCGPSINTAFPLCSSINQATEYNYLTRDAKTQKQVSVGGV